MDILNQLSLGNEGFNQANEETLQYLSKALTAGSGVDAASFTGGRALIPESLDTTLVNILHSQEDAVLFKKLKKQPIPSPVHQWDTRSEVGADDGAWVSEGGNSQDTDQTITRVYATAKYLQTRRTVTLQASVSNMIENAIALEKNAGTLWIIRNVEKALFNANSTYNSLEPDGLKAQVTTHVIDVRGATANSSSFADAIELGSKQIRDSFGKPTDIFCSTMVMTDVQKLLRDRIRFEPGQEQFGGSVFMKYPTPFGTIELNPDVFLKEGTIPAASSLSGRPDAPTVSGSRTTTSGSQFTAADAGDYIYKVVGINQYGDGDASAEISVTSVVAGDGVTLAVTRGTTVPTAYKVYRSKKNATTGAILNYAFTVAYASSPQNIVDLNADLPGCSDAYILNLDNAYDAIEWAQFLPMMKFDLYPTNAAVYPFLMLLFGTLAVKKPSQHVRIKNIQPSNLGWF